MLAERYGALLFDLDGVVYTGPEPVPGAVPALEELRTRRPIRYVTNNASRPPEAVSAQLNELGIAAHPDEVVSSAQAVAAELLETYGAAAKILTVGGVGLRQALAASGLEPVGSLSDAPVAAVQGFAPEVSWRDLAELTAAVYEGIPWHASNLDLTLPTERGTMPGNGALVQAVSTATGTRPRAAGKPEPGIFRTALAHAGAETALVVGDRLDTDILGGNRAGLGTALVLTGVHRIADAIQAPSEQRPDMIIVALPDLLTPVDERAAHLAGSVSVREGILELPADSSTQDLDPAVVTAAVRAVWASLDDGAGFDLDSLPRSWRT